MQHLHPSRLRRLLAGVFAIVGLLIFAASAAALAPGDPDPTFGSDGVVYYPLGAGSPAASQINGVALQPDGKIVLAGSATDASGHNALLVARLNTDGSLDQSFGDGGKVIRQLGAGDFASSSAGAVLVQTDGKIVVGGSARSDPNDGFIVARLNPGGNLDSTFGDHGKVLAQLASGEPDFPEILSLALQSDGKILAGGRATWTDAPHGDHEMLIARLNSSDGSPDSSFGDGGKVLARIGCPTSHQFSAAQGMEVQPDGKIVVAGYGPNCDTDDAMVGRLNPTDGSFDSGFGVGGLKLYAPFVGEGSGGAMDAVALQPDGKIVAAGLAFSGSLPGFRALVARFDGSNGSLDPFFGSGGNVLAPLGAGSSPEAEVKALALQPDGEIVAGGYATDSSGQNEVLLARLSGTNGSYDPTFGAGGAVLRQLGNGAGSEVHALVLQPDGNIVAAGLAGSSVMVTRLLGEASSPGGGGGTGGGGGGGSGNNVTPSTAIATLSKLGITPTVFSAADSGPTISRTVGAQVSYEDTAAVTTMFTVLKRSRGVLHKHRCMKPARGRIGKRCTRWPVVGRFTHADKVGLNSFHFSGRLHGRKLKPGRYRLRARPRFAGPTGQAVEVTFRIVS